MPNLRGSEWLVIILLLVLLFGAKRLPDAARSMGRSLRIFKAETKGLVDDDATPAGPAVASGQSATAPLAPPSASGVPVTPPSAAAAPVTPGGSTPPEAEPRSVQPQPGGALTPQPPAQT